LSDLERELLALRDEIAWPATPDVAAALQARVAAEPRDPRRARSLGLPGRPRRAPAWLVPAVAAVLVLLIAFGTLLAASPGVRATLRDWLGIGAVSVKRVERLPDLSPARRLELGRRVTAAQAARHLGHPVATVHALGAPDAIYAGDAIVPTRVSLVYVARPGLPPGTARIGALLDEVGTDSLPFIQKLVGARGMVEPVDVDGARGIFVSGPHAVVLPDDLRPRLAANTIVWVRDGITYRLETRLGLQGALRLARSVR
jgi:hypothetical protein